MESINKELLGYSRTVLEQCVEFLDSKLSDNYPEADTKTRNICSIIALCDMSYDRLYRLMYAEGKEYDELNAKMFDACVDTVKARQTIKLEFLRDDDLKQNPEPQR